MTDRRKRRPHSRQGRTAQTRALQKLRRGGNEPSNTKNILVYWRICHRRERTQAERRAYHRSRMLQIRIDNHFKYLEFKRVQNES